MHIAAFFAERGREPVRESELFGYCPRFKTSVCWGINKAATAAPAQVSILGNGVHAKIYELTNGAIIISSQNNGSSGLVETAILYERPKKNLKNYISKCVSWIPAFQAMFKRTQNFCVNLGGS
jgi:hypothetical protein